MQSQSFLGRWAMPVLHTVTSALVVSSSAMADDTEVFAAQAAATSKPNIMFVLDYSESMLNPVPLTGETRIDTLRNSVNLLLDQYSGQINAGIGSLFDLTSTGVLWPAGDLEADAHTIDPSIPAGTKTSADVMKSILERDVTFHTSSLPALVEAASYFRGDEVPHSSIDVNRSDYHKPPVWDAVLERYTGESLRAALPATYERADGTDAYQPTGGINSYGICHDFTVGGTVRGAVNECAGLAAYACTFNKPRGITIAASERCRYPRDDVWQGAKYKSPISRQCQVNAIVMVSDGRPTNPPLANSDAAIEKIIRRRADTCATAPYFPDGIGRPAHCGPEIARTLATSPQVPGIPDSFVNTYTIGFATNDVGATFLENVATAGEGQFFNVDTASELNDAFDSILSGLALGGRSFAPLAVDADRTNFSHDNRAFLSLFKPSLNTSWYGNLKGYFIDDSGLSDINNNPATVLVDDVNVFREDAQSFWSTAPDGEDISAGGASALLEIGRRNLYTYTGPSNIPRSGVRLSNTTGEHDLTVSNNLISDAALGGTGSRDVVLDWLQTVPMGDPLHSQPVQISYDNTGSNQQVVYMMTNQGFLHAIDASEPLSPNGNVAGGDEIFAFMPQELLKNLPRQYANIETTEHTYGLDGSLIQWHNDENRDGVVNGRDTVTLVFGMRRGGNHYYALDVTNPRSPILKWRLDGGSAELPRLGETWSRPSLVSVNRNGNIEDVLAFGGGYDAAKLDGTTKRVAGTLGNAIYMVDEDGDVVMSIDNSDIPGMDYAIPSDLTIIDTDGDSVTDRIYVGDLGGNIWRIDYDDIARGADGEKLADLNDRGHRTFFYPPSVTLNSSVRGDFLSVAIGSGNRTNPLRLGSNDRIFMVRDANISTPLPASHTPFRVSDLYNATANRLDSSNGRVASKARDDLNDAQGWYINLGANEKSITPLVTFQGRLMATTFNVEAAETDPTYCGSVGSNSVYIMDPATAQPIALASAAGRGTASSVPQRSTMVSGGSILSQPTVVFPENGDITVFVDNEVVSTVSPTTSRVYWYAK